ncbi:MAG: NADH-quinone oxidoreductase subunit J [Flavobacteriales bacterium CG_4_9_14_0_2_um_filter_35_242]|nr:NADH-quinone oxidoreductase subunit J [Zetaproteobacteria bacterium]NDK17963.1 NADH-quinone oxidoreductase subunit J [Flavobacteriales bacterium]OIO12542.1 MAG: NADH dehydrogenase [Flavobacteriaceae bacterium CG1_02_35_72]PIR14849.1 MAG: NADH-quinone oxidoreductase subunit J [Flavobacteriales bacterium CG11_big_fil_rev_8_21_14_0_20_35_7]PIV18281.1 MAG: NADH-quinone oxidoreductase subunit J [Flavobacteriales bacterium CG03_land_8_20_14_0_80_35_15]PIX07534.1 MAG: NADH-quinone oxidoreductase s
MEQIIFYILAAIIVIFAVAAVNSRKILHAVIYLLFVLASVAGIYFLVNYNFLAALQLAIYAGGVIVLIIFSVMLTHNIDAQLEIASLKSKLIAGALSIGGMAVTLYAIYSYQFNSIENHQAIEVSDIGLKLLSFERGGYVLPFEVISILLLAILIGAIVIAKGQHLIEQEHKQNQQKL